MNSIYIVNANLDQNMQTNVEMLTVNQLQYVTFQIFQNPTNGDSTCLSQQK